MNKNGQLKKTEIFKTTYSQYFFATILGIAPYGLSRDNALRINLSYKSKDFFFFFIPLKIRHKSWGRMDGTQFLGLLWFPAKNNPTQTFLGSVFTI